MAERAYTTANWRGREPCDGWRCQDPTKPEYWKGKDMVLMAGACVARATVVLAERYLAEVDVYREKTKEWLLFRISFPEGSLDQELTRAQDFSARQGTDFMIKKSEERGMWDVLMTDLMKVADVMDS